MSVITEQKIVSAYLMRCDLPWPQPAGKICPIEEDPEERSSSVPIWMLGVHSIANASVIRMGLSRAKTL